MDMTAKMVLGIALKAGIALMMMSLGLRTARADLLQLWRSPRLLVGSLVAAFVAVPVAAYLAFEILPLSFEARVGLWVVAITPGAPMIYRGALSRGDLGNPRLAASFQVTVAAFVVVLAPVWLAIASAVSGSSYWIPPRVILAQVAQVQLVPILVGLLVRGHLPEFAGYCQAVIAKVAWAVLVALVVIFLTVLAPRLLASAELWAVAGAVMVAVAAVAAGHWLAGPDLASRVTIANANAQRNPGLALAIAAWNLPEQRSSVVLVIVTYVLVSVAVAAVYTKVMRKRQARTS